MKSIGCLTMVFVLKEGLLSIVRETSSCKVEETQEKKGYHHDSHDGDDDDPKGKKEINTAWTLQNKCFALMMMLLKVREGVALILGTVLLQCDDAYVEETGMMTLYFE